MSDRTVSLRIVVPRCQSPGEKKAQDFASLPQAGESPRRISAPYCGLSWFEKRNDMNALLYGLVVVIWG
ncbi:hypothetical protein M8368_14245, partial [Enterobacter kobei]|nr:hypothetical protein [Enterobacter kobei]